MELKKNIFFILKSIGLGLIIYSITGLLLATILVYIFQSDHPHSMEELLYLIVPGIGAIAGISLGFILAVFHLEKYAINLVLKQLLIGIPFSIALFFLVTCTLI